MLRQCFDANVIFARTACLIAIAIALPITACAPEPETAKPPRSVKAMQVVAPSTLASRSFPGRAEAGQEVNLSFRVAGPLIELPVTVGDRVKQGDVVARIDPTDFESDVAGLEGQLQAAQAAANRAQADFERIDRTFREDPGATTEMALDRVRQLRDSTAATVRGLRATVEGARNQLSYTSLSVPFAGEVVETYVENFETVIAKQPILRVVDPTRIEFTISVPENQIGYAPYVTSVQVSFDALPGINVPAVIKEISKEASRATRTYPVTLAMEQPQGAEILPGMAGEALMEADLPEDSARLGIQIPTTALFAEDDPSKSYVWVIDPATNTLERREVQTGDLSEVGILIKSGLEANEWVVVAGATLLSAGEEVRILGASGESATQ
ncbi:MAG: efflux RND transporter periplasmic adaptor subunit [Gammaproteobacteria bacterium]|nr:efflux RND transporter periplasmic adaptor subunit [Gammaproteobacteria bacterium]